MKIGEFVRKNDTTIDTIRYYMELNLILPQKKGGQYDFDSGCQNDFNGISELKNMGFTLKEIRNIFNVKRIGKGALYEENENYRRLFIDKYNQVTEQIKKELISRRKIKGYIKSLKNLKMESSNVFGVNINLLSKLACPKCNSNLMLMDGRVSENKVINGKLKCNCGKEYTIQDGILYGENFIETEEDENSWKDIVEYVNGTDSAYMESLAESLKWFYMEKCFENYDNKNILDLGSGMGLTLRYFYDEIKESTAYFAVDYDARRQKYLKNVLQKNKRKSNIVLMCCDFNEIPLKRKSVDVIIDGSGSSTYAFSNKEFLLDKIDKYISEKSIIAGFYIIFKKFSFNNFIKAENRDNFKLDNIKSSIEQLGYDILNENSTNYIKNGGKYDKFFLKDYIVYFYTCYCKR